MKRQVTNPIIGTQSGARTCHAGAATFWRRNRNSKTSTNANTTRVASEVLSASRSHGTASVSMMTDSTMSRGGDQRRSRFGMDATDDPR